MKQKQRVPQGEKYWIIDIDGEIWYRDNNDGVMDDKLYETGNHFRSKEEAESMAKKLRAVLKGADVIEMPSEEEFDEYLNTHFPYKGGTKGLICETTKGEWKECFRYLKSKVK